MADPAELLGFGRTPPHDYDVGLQDRWTAPWSRALVLGLTALGALAVGFLLATGLSAGREEAVAQSERKDELVGLIQERQERADELSAELEELRRRVEAVQSEAAAGVPALRAEIAEVELAAGLVGLTGPGLRITLRDAPDTCPSTPYACRIQDGDVQRAVNALFEAGAEAVSVGGERVVATTAIRAVGQTIRVNLRVIAPPYEIEALGDPGHLRRDLQETAFAEDFAGWARDYGLGMDITEVREVRMPRFTGALGMDARPPGDGSAIGADQTVLR